MANINEALLDERLAALEGKRGWSPRLISRLEQHIRAAPDRALFRINPLSFAAERGLPDGEIVDLFLHATAIGLFDMNWMLLCPVCSGVVQSFQRLNTVEKQYFCYPCQTGFDAKLDEYIAISFTLRPEIRDLAFHHPERLSPRDYYFEYCSAPEGCLPNGIPFTRVKEQATLEIAHLPPGEVTRLQVEATDGYIFAFSHEGGVALLLTVDTARPALPQQIDLVFGDRAHGYDMRSIPPGPLTVSLRNERRERGTVLLARMPPDFPLEPHPLDFKPFLSGKRLLTTQTFRDLFRTEVIGGEGGLAIADIALLFTDLKGSTDLYDRIGDLNAFNLVQQHFDRLQEITVRHRGAIIKTIGDAVMAAFLEPVDAVKAAIDMRREIAGFRPGQQGRDLILKIGIHKGAAIAVTLNDRLDYFGQTVNIAARVQHLADADDIYLSEAVFEAPAVQTAIAGLPVEPQNAKLRGIIEAQRVYRVGSEST